MDCDILDSLEDLGYSESGLDEKIFGEAIEGGAGSLEYTKLVEWLTKELSELTGLEDHVTATTAPEDAETFLMELSGFLREFGCPYSQLINGPITERLDTRQNKLTLLDFLITELQACRMIAVNKPHLAKKVVLPDSEQSGGSETGRCLKSMLITLNFPKPPEGVTSFQLFSKVEGKLKELISHCQSAHLGKPLLKARLSDKQWDVVQYMNEALRQEYLTRREMVLKRLDVTIQSFTWSDKAKSRQDLLAAQYQPIRSKLTSKVNVDMAHLLAARDDLLRVEKTSSGVAREKTKCDINKVVIGKVPDRGGRAYEHDIPAPEMPAFQQRQSQPQQQRQQSGGRGGRGGGGRGDGGDRSWGGDRSGNDAGRGSSWGQNPQFSAQPPSNNPTAGFFGGGTGAGYQQGGYQQGGYQQGGYQQGGYQQSRGGQGGGGGRGGGGRGGWGRGGRGGRRGN